MRKMILALVVTFVAPTALTALPATGDSQFGAPAGTIQQHETLPGSVARSEPGASSGGKVILAKGDKSGTGPGAGGHKGQKKGGRHGKQHQDKKD